MVSVQFFLNHQHTINVKMLKPKVIAAVSALAEFQNYRLAAEQTQNTPSTFSRYIANAEQYIGHKIFERQGKKWVPTPAGKKFLSDLKNLNGALNNFTTGLSALQRQGPQTLRIGCGPLATRAVVTSHLAEVFQRAPYIQASITVDATDAPINQLITGQLDLIVCDMTHFDATPELEIHALATRNVTLWTRPEHPAQAEENLTLAKALKYPFVTNYLPSYWKNRLNKAVSEGAQDKIHPDFVPHFQSDDFSAAADLATRCDMICTGMPEDFEHYRQAGALVELSIQDELPWNLCVARRKEMGFPVLDLFWDRLVAN